MLSNNFIKEENKTTKLQLEKGKLKKTQKKL